MVNNRVKTLLEARILLQPGSFTFLQAEKVS